MLGIDLGTSNTVAAYIEGSKCELTVFSDSQRLLPSYIYFDYNIDTGKIQPIFGKYAKQNTLHPENLIYGAKRLIGRTFDHSKVQEFIKNNPQLRIENRNGKPEYKITVENPNKKGKFITEYYSPERISAEFLIEAKTRYKYHTGKDAQKVLITVPAKFNSNQRAGTLSAARMAGFEEENILFSSEPTAAAYMFRYYQDETKNIDLTQKIVLIFDLGAGTLDVSIVRYNTDSFDVLAVEGDTDLGGQDFDQILFNEILNQFMASTDNPNVKPSERSLKRLLNQCEEAKKTLSSAISTSIIVDNFIGEVNLDIKLRRKQFERLIEPKIRKAIPIIEKALHNASITKNDIYTVIPIGGSCYIPCIISMLQEYFDGEGTAIVSKLEYEYAVAKGAAYMRRDGCPKENLPSGGIVQIEESKIVQDILPSKIGVKVKEDEFFAYIGAGQKFPFTAEYPFTPEEGKNSIQLSIYQGDSDKCSENTLIRNINIDNIPSDIPTVWVKLEMNSNGILNFKLTNSEIGLFRELQNIPCIGARTEDEIERNNRELEERERLSTLKQDLIRNLEKLKTEVLVAKRKSRAKAKFIKFETEIDDLINEIDESFDPVIHQDQYEEILRNFKSK